MRRRSQNTWGHPSIFKCGFRRRVSPYSFFILVCICLCIAHSAYAERLQHFELPKKAELAPIVVTGYVVKANDKEAEIQIKDSLKGELKSGETIKVENNVEVKP